MYINVSYHLELFRRTLKLVYLYYRGTTRLLYLFNFGFLKIGNHSGLPNFLGWYLYKWNQLVKIPYLWTLSDPHSTRPRFTRPSTPWWKSYLPGPYKTTSTNSLPNDFSVLRRNYYRVLIHMIHSKVVDSRY